MEIERIIPKESILNERITNIKRAVRVPVHADWERAHLMTEYWRHSDGEPVTIKKARALDKIMSEMTIDIFEGELIVGSLTKYRVGNIFLPEFNVDFIKDEWDSFSSRESERVIPPEEDKETVFKDIEFWEGKTLQDTLIPMWRQKWGSLIDDIIEARITTDHRTI
ncbi:MAG: pyruvate formate lyase family protein, partial [Thermodesulfobacteriota bacterium]|nr:pyruvate formate lyase family protein [Thermodesulfobacteriota bacterium]